MGPTKLKKSQDVYHGLRSRTALCLTATDLVNENSPFWPSPQNRKCEFKNPRWRRRPIGKSKNRNIFAMDWPVLRKFGMVMCIGPPYPLFCNYFEQYGLLMIHNVSVSINIDAFTNVDNLFIFNYYWSLRLNSGFGGRHLDHPGERTLDNVAMVTHTYPENMGTTSGFSTLGGLDPR